MCTGPVSSGDGECNEEFQDLKCAEPKRLPHSKLRPKRFLQEKTGNYFLPECLEFSFADAFFIKVSYFAPITGPIPHVAKYLAQGGNRHSIFRPSVPGLKHATFM